MLRLTTLGRLELTRDGVPVLAGRRKLVAVLAYLARTAPRTVSRARLADLFWPVEDAERGRRSVRQALTELRRAANGAIREQDDAVGVERGAIEIDADRFEAASAAGDHRLALELWGGEFLAGVEDVGGEDVRGWLEAEREGLRRRLARAAELAVEAAAASGDAASAVAAAERWAAALPLDERAHLRLAQSLRLAGRAGEAHARLAQFAGRLRAELGVEPSAEVASALVPAEPVRTLPGSVRLFTPDLAGRAAVLAELAAQWEAAVGGGAGAVLVEGDDGIGKSRLGAEVAQWVRARTPDALVLEARGYEAERRRAWSLARHLLAPLADASGVAASPPEVLAAIAGLVPELRARFPRLPAPADVDSSGGYNIAEMVRRVLADIADEAPLLVLVDDLPNADAASAELIAALLRRPVPHALVVLTARPDDLPLLSASARGALASARRVALAPLGADDVEAMIVSMLDLPTPTRRALARRLWTEGHGNPAYVVQAVANLADAGALAPGADGVWRLDLDLERAAIPLPTGIRETLGERFNRLTPPARQVVEAAAVLGGRADLAPLRALSGLPVEVFDAALDEACVHRLLVEAPGAPNRFEFASEVMRRVAYDQLPPGRRRALHSTAVSVLGAEPGGAPGEAARAELAYHRERAGHDTRRTRLVAGRKWLAAGGVAAALLAVLAGAARVVRHPAAPATSPTLVAVLPFTVRGSSQYAYLGDGMVHLLGADLDGLGEFRTADPRALLAFVSQRPLDPATGRVAAARVGAGLFVLGDVVEVNGRIDLAASLYDARGVLQGVARAGAGSEEGIYGAVDEIARQLLVSRRRGPSEEITRLAAATSSSLPALKAYLEGERLLREGRFSEAVEAFQRAVAADTTFALAYYRLAIAAEWDQQATLPERAAEEAARYGNRLSERSRELVQALLAWRRGDVAEARGRYQTIVARHPEDVEAWFQYGEVLFHFNPVEGRPIAEATEAWERVLSFEPENRFAMLHLARIAAAEDDSSGLDAYVKRLPEPSADDDRRLLELAAWHALIFRNRAEEDRVLRYMRRPFLSLITVVQLVTYSRNVDGSERFARAIRQPDSPMRAHLLVQLELARGKWRAAGATLASPSAIRIESTPLLSRAFVASLAFVSLPSAELRRVREALEAWTPPIVQLDSHNERLNPVNAFVYPQLQQYLLGMLSVRLGDTAAAAGHAAALERMPRPPYTKNLVPDLVLGLRAMVARAEGRREPALRLLEQMRPAATRGQVSQSPFYARAMERYVRAELLRELGRDEEALAWYASLAQLSPYELVFLAPSCLRRAEIYERLGRRAEAAQHYARFIDLWKDADPESQPLVAEARQRLARLQQD